MKYVSVSQMQAIEREANESGLSYAQMMENAGRGLAEVILDHYGYLEDEGALGLVGSGNNGGDALVALAHLADAGWKVCAVIVRTRPANDPLIARVVEAGGEVITIHERIESSQLDHLLAEYAVLLDGVLGTGFRLPLSGPLAELLDAFRRRIEVMDHPPIVVAVDCPSGVDCDSGQAASECIPSDHTVTMAAVKQGLLKFPAYKLVGNLDVVEIGLADGGSGLAAWRSVQTFIPDQEWVSDHLPLRPLDAHKGTFGTALIIAGSANYSGAALLAGRAAYRVGTGLVTLAIPEILHPALAGQLPEATWLLLPHQKGAIGVQASQMVFENLGRTTCLLVGPGLGLSESTSQFLELLCTGSNLPPMVIDADGLKLLKNQANWSKQLPAPTILTPHPGEMSILTGLPVEQIQKARLETAQQFSLEWGHVVVLKGAFSVIAAPDGQAAIIPVASPALARAGTGDVLAGLIAGLRAQGISAFQSAVVGAWIHAAGGLRAAAALGNSASVLAGDVLRYAIEEISELN